MIYASAAFLKDTPLESWRAVYQPQVVLVSVAPGDREGRPDEAVLKALEGYTLLSTDQNGWIEFSIDGERR